MRRTLSRPDQFFFLFLILLYLSMQILYWVVGSEDLFFRINGSYGVFFDYLFYGWTLMGEWPLIVFALIYTGVYHRSRLLALIAAFCLNAIISYILKFHVFSEVLRPTMVFADHPDLFISPFLKAHKLYSFPSGHTFTAFTGFMMMALVNKSLITRFVLIFLALGVGFSRIYNGLHFPQDVMAGAVLGIVVSVLMHYFVKDWKPKFFKP